MVNRPISLGPLQYNIHATVSYVFSLRMNFPVSRQSKQKGCLLPPRVQIFKFPSIEMAYAERAYIRSMIDILILV